MSRLSFVPVLLLASLAGLTRAEMPPGTDAGAETAAEDAAWQDLEHLLVGWAERAAVYHGSFACRVRSESGGKEDLSLRLAIRDRGHALLEVHSPEGTFLAACGAGGCWLRSPYEDAVTHCATAKQAPLPMARMWYDPKAENKSNLIFGLEVTEERPVLCTASKEFVVHNLAKWRAAGYRLTRVDERDPQGRHRTVFHAALHEHGREVHAVVLEIDPDGVLYRLRFTVAADTPGVLTLSDVVVREELPEELLQVRPPEGLAVKEVESVDLNAWINRLAMDVMKTLNSAKKRNDEPQESTAPPGENRARTR